MIIFRGKKVVHENSFYYLDYTRKECLIMNNLIGSLIKNKSLRESSSFLHKLRYIPYNLETTSKSKNRFETSENEDLGDCRSLKDVNELINCGAYQEAKNYLEKINSWR